MGDEKKKKTIKRLKGVALAELRAAVKAVHLKQKELKQFQEDWVDNHPLYFVDQVSFPLGLIYDADLEKVGKKDRVAVARIPKEIMSQVRALGREIEELDEAAAEVRARFARRMGVNTSALDPNTGIVQMEPEEHVFVDVDPTEEGVQAEAEKIAGAIDFDE